MQWTLITRNTKTGTTIHECPGCYGCVCQDDFDGHVEIEDIVEDAVKGDHGCDRCDNANRPDDATAAIQYECVTGPQPGSVLVEQNA